MSTTRPSRASRPVLATAVVAALVVVAAVVTAVLLRPDPAAPVSGTSAGAAPQPSSAQAGCGGGACQEVATAEVGGTRVALLTDAAGNAAQVRFGGGTVLETRVTSMGARLDGDSLYCMAGGESGMSACLVRGSGDRGMIGELLVSRGEGWRPVERPYFSDAGIIVLDDVNGDGAPDVVVVQHLCSQSGSPSCEQAPVRAEVFGLGGEQYGCTGRYTAPAHMRGWPEVRVNSWELRPCG